VHPIKLKPASVFQVGSINVGRGVRCFKLLEVPGLFYGEANEDASTFVVNVIAAWEQPL
jgi:hypothetical protein